MYLSETEEIIAFVVCIAIVIGFAVSTYLEIKNTISEEKNKQKEKNRFAIQRFHHQRHQA